MGLFFALFSPRTHDFIFLYFLVVVERAKSDPGVRVIVVVTLAFAALLIKMVTVEKGGKERNWRGVGGRRGQVLVG